MSDEYDSDSTIDNIDSRVTTCQLRNFYNQYLKDSKMIFFQNIKENFVGMTINKIY